MVDGFRPLQNGLYIISIFQNLRSTECPTKLVWRLCKSEPSQLPLDAEACATSYGFDHWLLGMSGLGGPVIWFVDGWDDWVRILGTNLLFCHRSSLQFMQRYSKSEKIQILWTKPTCTFSWCQQFCAWLMSRCLFWVYITILGPRTEVKEFRAKDEKLHTSFTQPSDTLGIVSKKCHFRKATCFPNHDFLWPGCKMCVLLLQFQGVRCWGL